MTDMTCGSPRRHLVRFAVPILLGSWLQLLYNAVDAAIAGRFIGKDALAAEGIASPVMNLVILSVTGLTVGAGVLLSEYFGAKKPEDYRRGLATLLLSGTAASLILTAAGWLLAPWLLRLLSVPDELFDSAAAYLRVTFLGMPFTFFYNALSAGLKSAGESRVPLRFLAFSSLLNAALDLIFLGIFHLGIVCSAATTVAAEAVSAAAAGLYMRLKLPELWPRGKDARIKREMFFQILRYGAPTALQQAVQPIGKLVIQGQINALGVASIAAFTAAGRMDDFACIPEQGISASLSTYIAQNRGAGKTERIRGGFRSAVAMEAAYGLFIGLVTLFLRGPIVSFFVEGEAAQEVISLGKNYLGLMSLFYTLPALTNGVQGFFRGTGRMKTMIMGTFLQISLRALFTAVLCPRLGLNGLAWASAIGWSAMTAVDYPLYFYLCCKYRLPPREE